jgi:diaminopimelate decarboxylase
VGEVVLARAPFARADGGALACEGVLLDDIAERVGTPAYVYSAAAVRGSTRSSRTRSRASRTASTTA